MPESLNCFVDTNVLLYSVDEASPEKRGKARAWMSFLWERASGRLSWQVLHEFSANAERKFKLPRPLVRNTVRTLIEWNPVDTSAGLLDQAWHWADAAQIAYWDSLIVAAAEWSACVWLLSEDFQAGRRFGSVTVVNPFLQAPQQLGAPARLR